VKVQNITQNLVQNDFYLGLKIDGTLLFSCWGKHPQLERPTGKRGSNPDKNQ